MRYRRSGYLYVSEICADLLKVVIKFMRIIFMRFRISKECTIVHIQKNALHGVYYSGEVNWNHH